MGEGKMLDIAHISFLDMIKAQIAMTGAAVAKGSLIRNAVSAGEKIKEVNYDTFDDYLAAIENETNPIALIEGKSVHKGEFIFGLPKCPFEQSIKNYKTIYGQLPEEYAEFTDEFNKTGRVTDMYRVGEGGGVSPFCAVHQPMRSTVAEKITIGGKNIHIYQLGCKSGAGAKGFAQKWIDETGASKDDIDKVLDNNMCCYYLKIEE